MLLLKMQYKYEWLGVLKRVQCLIDKATELNIKKRLETCGDKPACGVGCCECCKDHVIPVSAPEICGAMWYLGTVVSGVIKETVLKNIMNRNRVDCPFLVEGVCAVYPFRFLACRQFHVYGTRCIGHEDVIALRPGDILYPDNDVKKKALLLLSTLYNVNSELIVDELFLKKFIMDVSAPIHLWDISCVDKLLFQLENNMLHYRVVL